LLHERRAGGDGRGVGAKKFLFPDVVLAAVPVAVENRGNLAGRVLRQEQVARHGGASEIVELELLHDIVALVLSRERANGGHAWPRRQFAEQLPELGADFAAGVLPQAAVGGNLEG
jgi:hypothetical protein